MSWGAALGAGLGILDTGLQMYSAREAWKKQKEALQHQHQWEVEDLRKAGLNPVLSATGGSGAGGLNMPMPSTSGLSNAARNFVDASFKEKQKELIDSQVKNVSADTALKESQTYAQNALRRSYEYQAAVNSETAYNLYRANKFMDANPDLYSIKQANEAVPGLGAAVGILGGAYNSAMGLSNRYSDRVRFHNDHGISVPLYIGGSGGK